MYDVKVDRQKNRLYILFKGQINDVEASLAGEEVLQALDELQPGFTVIADLSGTVPVSPQASEYIKRGQLAIARKGVKKAVRVVQNIVGAMQFKRIQEETGVTYDVIQVTSLEEAERILDEEDV